jgi:hypothetical protein
VLFLDTEAKVESQTVPNVPSVLDEEGMVPVAGRCCMVSLVVLNCLLAHAMMYHSLYISGGTASVLCGV